jgi:N-methylhydantoinase B/oxoprolinase/acetone carboxylase alpha subunit
VFEARKLVMKPADQVVFETPGGGGFGAPSGTKSKGRSRGRAKTKPSNGGKR